MPTINKVFAKVSFVVEVTFEVDSDITEDMLEELILSAAQQEMEDDNYHTPIIFTREIYDENDNLISE